jgi:hypothetical protein
LDDFAKDESHQNLGDYRMELTTTPIRPKRNRAYQEKFYSSFKQTISIGEGETLFNGPGQLEYTP